MQDLRVYLINMDRAHERMARMRARLDEMRLPFERVAGVDGAGLRFPHPAFSARLYKYLHGRRVIPAEVGCYLSHVECARRLLDSDASHALILEDDLIFPADFRQIVSDALKHDDNWDILRLSTMNAGPKLPYKWLPGGRSLAVAITREKGAGAYIINRKAAEWITTRLLPMRLSYDIAFDMEYFHGLRASFVEPAPVSQRAEVVSQIQGRAVREAKYPRWRYLTVLPYRAGVELGRITARFYVYTRLSFRHEPRRAWIRALPSIMALGLGIDEVMDNW